VIFHIIRQGVARRCADKDGAAGILGELRAETAKALAEIRNYYAKA